ncbi:hypothetical protein XENORESO_008402, partial [Xenotaenia resolanae]
MSQHHPYQRGPHGRTMSSEERCSTPVNKTSIPVQKSASSSSSSQRDSRQEADSWEIIEGLKIGQSNVQKPDKHEGFMLKKRKWPLKGWHKRFFVLDNGILKYSKTPIDVRHGSGTKVTTPVAGFLGRQVVQNPPLTAKKLERELVAADTEVSVSTLFFIQSNESELELFGPVKQQYVWMSSGCILKCSQIQRGKLHGSIDVGLSVMSIKKRARRIDLDTEEHIYHLKVKSQDIFDAWVSKLRHHRLYRQNEIVRSPREPTMRTFPPSAVIESPQPSPSVVNEIKQAKTSSLPWQPAAPSSSSNSSLQASYSNGQSRVVAWLQESEEMDKCAEELARCQSNLTELSRLLQSLEILQRTQSVPNFTDMQ